MELGNLLWGNSRGEYPVDRSLQDDFCDLLEKMGADGYGHAIDDDKSNDRGGITTDTYEINPYWWGDEDDEEAEKPNFIFKPLGFELNWYKYPLRDSYSNIPLTKELLERIESEIVR